jgi:tRNA pseudouridine38-40 synthase
MQYNPGVKTIESVLNTALVRAGGILPSNADDFRVVRWTRAARTDKGVSAAGQVVAFQLRMEPNIISKINKALPNRIRVFGVKCAPAQIRLSTFVACKFVS